jgi:competence protein ComEA
MTIIKQKGVIMKKIHYVLLGLMLSMSYVLWPDVKTDVDMVYVDAPTIESFQVEVTGAVVFPGTYILYQPVTLDVLIGYAGGYLDHAKTDGLSMGQTIDRAYQLHVPFHDLQTEIEPLKTNVNRASFKDLIEVPHISETIAASIIIYREQNGPFFHLDELIHVKYIGPATLEKIKPHLSLG